MAPFKISVVALSNYSPSPLSAELQLLKAAAFYGDQVQFLGTVSGVNSLFLGLDDLSVEDQIRRLVRVGRGHREEIQKLPAQDRAKFNLFDNYVAKMDHARKTRTWSGQHENMKRKFHRIWEDSQEQRFQDPVLKQFKCAKESGYVKFSVLDFAQSFKGQSDQFIEHITKEISRSSSYPLFDALSGFLASHRLKSRQEEISNPTRQALAHMGFVAHSLDQLPTFETATMEEVLDLRQELDEHLGRFRAGMLGFSGLVQELPWDKSFQREADLIFRSEVVPAVDEVAAAAKGSTILDAIVRKATTNLGPTLTGVGTIVGGLVMAMSPTQMLNEVLASSLGWGTASIAGSLLALGVERERANKKAEVEGKQMYFYYRAQTELAKPKSNA